MVNECVWHGILPIHYVFLQLKKVLSPHISKSFWLICIALNLLCVCVHLSCFMPTASTLFTIDRQSHMDALVVKQLLKWKCLLMF